MALTIIEKPSNSAFVGNPMNVIIESDNLRDGSSSLRKKFKLGIILEIDTAGSFTSPVWEEKGRFEVSVHETVANSGEGQAVFNLQHILKSLIKKTHQTPSNNYTIENDNPFFFSSKNQLYYRFYYYETHETFPTITIELLDNSGILMAQLGGISNHECNKIGNDLSNYNDQFLTQQTRRKRSQDDTPEFVSKHNGTSSSISHSLYCAITYVDGTISAHIVIPLVVVQPFQTVTFSAGYTQLGIAAIATPGKEVHSWTIKFGGIESQPFVRDCRYFDCRNILLYENSMGCIETLFCTGKFELDIDIESTEAISLPSTSRNDIRTIVNNKSGVQEFRGRTGYISKATSIYLQQFILSDSIFWLYGYDGTEYGSLPIIIKDNNYPVTKCWQYLHFITFDFKLAHSLGNFDNTLPTV